MKKRILTIGSANMDFTSVTERLPEAGETFISKQGYMMSPGGKGANTAVAAARLGADSVFCARLGKDAYGTGLLEFYKNEGIDVRHVHMTKNTPTGLASVIVEEGGENRIIVYPGANGSISGEDVEGALITYPDALVMQLEISFDRVCQAVRYCNKKNIPVVLDAGSARVVLELSELGKLEIFSLNETETEFFTGIKPLAYESCIAAAIALRKTADTKYVVLRLGEKGCFIYDGIYANFVEGYKIAPVDTTAAGDCFTAALTLEYLRNGGNILEAAKYANAAGALTCMGEGAAMSLPVDSDVRKFMEDKEI